MRPSIMSKARTFNESTPGIDFSSTEEVETTPHLDLFRTSNINKTYIE